MCTHNVFLSVNFEWVDMAVFEENYEEATLILFKTYNKNLPIPVSHKSSFVCFFQMDKYFQAYCKGI